MVKEKFTLPKSDRMGSNRSFQKVYQEGTSVAGRYLVLYWRKTEEAKTRIGFAAGKKLGPAVVRNRLKRVMREAWRLYPIEMPTGYDFILVARRPLIGKKLSEAQVGLKEVFRKAGF